MDKEIPCAWINIYERLQAQGRLDNILNVHPAREWEDQLQGRLLLDEYRDRYVQEPEEKK